MHVTKLANHRLFTRIIVYRHATKMAMSLDSSSRHSHNSHASTSSSLTSTSSSTRNLLVVFRENAASAVKRLPRWTTPVLSIVGGAFGFWLAGASILVGVGSSIVTGVVVLSLRFGAGDKPDFLTPLFEECVEDVKKLLTVLEQKLQEEYNASKYPLFVNLMLLKLHQTREQNGADETNESPAILIHPAESHRPASFTDVNSALPSSSSTTTLLDDDADAYLQYAAAAYGTTMNPDLITTVYHPKTIIFNQEDLFDESTQSTPKADENWSQIISKRVITQLTGLNDAAIKVVQLEGETALMPRYFIAVDEARRVVVLCIRGTLSLSDVLTDVCAECVPFKEMGVAHQGISAGAERLKEETLETLNQLIGRWCP